MSGGRQAGSSSAQPDDSEPTPERQVALRAAYEANVAAGRPPYTGVALHTRGELLWLMRERCWSGGPDPLPAGHERADLRGVNCFTADLRGVLLAFANLRGTVLDSANLSGADLRATRMDEATELYHVVLDSQTLLADIVWNGAPLTRVDWGQVRLLGDEQVARTAYDQQGQRKDQTTRLDEYTDAMLANRQLASVLRSQGLNEHADHFAYRAHLCHRAVLLRLALVREAAPRGGLGQRLRKLASFIASGLLDLIAGYGYRPLRTLFWYLAVIGSFAFAYYMAARGVITFGLHQSMFQPLAWYEALVLSVSSFHGRGFFQPVQSLGDPVAILAAAEAVFGLFIEISFIATFTQRYFGK